MIAVILPTRGLVFTQVEDAIERERAFADLRIYRSYSLPIPIAQNHLIRNAINDEPVTGRFTHFWFIEEDTVPPLDSLQLMLEEDSDIVCIDYAVNGYSCITRDKHTNDILWCGMGCTLIKREVFDKIQQPWFKTDKSLRLNDWQWIDTNPNKVYGQQDIRFCFEAKQNGFKITQIDGECEHLQLDELGKSGINNGVHKITEKPKISKYNFISLE